MFKVQLSMLAALLLCVGSLAEAGGYSRAVATEGGYAESSVEGHGNADVRGIASATRGGRAFTQATGVGCNGGRTNVLVNSVADGGEAEAIGTGRAYNGGYSESTAHAVTINGRSYSRDWACSNGNADARSHTSAFSHHGAAWANGMAEADGNGGEAVSRNILHAETWGGQADGESVASSRAKRGGRAYSESDVTSFSRPGRKSNARFVSEAEASFGGTAVSRGLFRDVR
jgi:hypothetical protein